MFFEIVTKYHDIVYINFNEKNKILEKFDLFVVARKRNYFENS